MIKLYLIKSTKTYKAKNKVELKPMTSGSLPKTERKPILNKINKNKNFLSIYNFFSPSVTFKWEFYIYNHYPVFSTLTTNLIIPKILIKPAFIDPQ